MAPPKKTRAGSPAVERLDRFEMFRQILPEEERRDLDRQVSALSCMLRRGRGVTLSPRGARELLMALVDFYADHARPAFSGNNE